MSDLRVNTVSDAAGTGPATLTGQYAAKAWVNFNGTGTVAIRESGNVSSITDNGTGNYTVNFTTAMADANYSVVGTHAGHDGTNRVRASTLITENDAAGDYFARTSSAFRASIWDIPGSSLYDVIAINLAVVR